VRWEGRPFLAYTHHALHSSDILAFKQAWAKGRGAVAFVTTSKYAQILWVVFCSMKLLSKPRLIDLVVSPESLFSKCP